MKIKLKEIIILVLFILVVSAVAIFIKNVIRDKNQEKEIEALINVEFKGESGSGETASGSVEEKKKRKLLLRVMQLLFFKFHLRELEEW